MSDSSKSRAELLREVAALRARLVALEPEAHRCQAEEEALAQRARRYRDRLDAAQRDIAGRERVEAELRASRERFRALIDATVLTDPDLLERGLHNLMSNAVRHTRTGAVLLGSRRRGNFLRIEVWDTGQGIPEDQLGHIFEEFYQLGNPARNRRQGLGLGLAIAKRIADLLGIRLGAASRVGKGSVFFVEVPLVKAGGPEWVEGAPIDGFQRLLALTLLVVDDDERVLLATARLLRLWGVRPLCAASAAEALALLESQSSRPDAALVDYRLSGSANGIELLQAMRERLGQDLPAILITGDTAAERLREAQASGYPLLHKPLAPSDLRRAILHHFAAKPALDPIADSVQISKEPT